ncbi:MAG: hypothetical protein R2932_40035 [Caldilineaceae bacterium]
MATTLSTQKQPTLTSRQRRLVNASLIHLALLAGVTLMFIPLLWTIVTSFKAPAEVFLFPPKWIPSTWHPENYLEATTKIPFFRYAWNTAFITGMAIIGKVISITLVAFAFRGCAGGARCDVYRHVGDDDVTAAYHVDPPIHSL